MFTQPKNSRYYDGCNESLLRAVSATAITILEVGCGTGELGARLKKLNPRRRVVGVECESQVAEIARTRLDEVHCLDVQNEDPPLENQGFDCILFGDVLEHLIAPDAVLARFKPFLKPDGVILCSIPNFQHAMIVEALLTGDLQYSTEGLLDATHLRFFTHSTVIKLFMDAGLVPQIVDVVTVPVSQTFLNALLPLLQLLNLDPRRTQRYLEAYQLIVKGMPIKKDSPAPGIEDSMPPLSFVACVSNDAIHQANLLSSPCLAAGSPHEILLMRECRSAAEGLNRGLMRARNELVVCLHQDVYLPCDWPARFWRQYRLAERQFGALGVVGVYGIAGCGPAAQRVGHVVDRDRLLWESPSLPAKVDTLDELLLALPKRTPLSLDARLGFHLYGSDLCLSATCRGLTNVVFDALCFHNSRSVGLPPAFGDSVSAFATKWRQFLPVATPCVRIDATGRVEIW